MSLASYCNGPLDGKLFEPCNRHMHTPWSSSERQGSKDMTVTAPRVQLRYGNMEAFYLEKKNSNRLR